MTDKHENKNLVIPWLYDLVLWMLSVIIDLFFREVHPRGAWKVPKKGPVILVAAPHANQFIDPLILMRVIKTETKRRISFLIAAKSIARPFIGTVAKAAGSLPVARALDSVKPAEGKIFLPDQDNDPCLVQGVGTNFKSKQFQIGGLIVLPKVKGQTPSTEIGEIISDTQLRLKKPFKTPEALESLTKDGSDSEEKGSASKGTKFKVAPHVDQTQVYDAVFAELIGGGTIGMFPEGGSHDRTELLPLKAGVAIMALGALSKSPDCGLKIIPVGMNYFHAHKFRSRAVVEFGHPIEVDPDQVAAFKAGDRRNAVGSLLETIHQGLDAVTQQAPDYDTLMLAQAARRLYNPTGKKMPLPTVVDLNRRLLKGYVQYKDDPRVVDMKRDVLEYNRRLRILGIKDHQVEWGNAATRPWWFVLGTLIYRLLEILVLSIGTFPGLAMFWPVFVTTKVISVRKSKEALAASTVKLQGRDVIATWKVLVSLAFVPALYAYYTIVVSCWLYYNRQGGHYTYAVPWWMVARTYVPDWVPIWLFAIVFLIVCTLVTFAALRIGEVGMDVVKSLPPLFVALDPRSWNSLAKLRGRREALAIKVTGVINTLGPEVYPDFNVERIVADPFRDGAYQSRMKRMPEPANRSGASTPSTPTSTTFEDASPPTSPFGMAFGILPSNDSFKNIGTFGFFASQPGTPKSHSRSSSATGRGGALGGLKMKPFSSIIDSKASLDEITQRIRGAMRERGRKRESEGGDTESSFDMLSSGAQTPGSEGEGEVEDKKDR